MTQPQPFASIRYFFNALGPGFAPALSGLSRLVTDGTGTIWAQWRLVPHLRLQLLEEVLDHGVSFRREGGRRILPLSQALSFLMENLCALRRHTTFRRRDLPTASPVPLACRLPVPTCPSPGHRLLLS